MPPGFIDLLVELPMLSIRQPWASYVSTGSKRVELRSWQPRYRGWLWIHAGKQPDKLAMELLGLEGSDFQLGGFVGLACLGRCIRIEDEQTWSRYKSEHLSPGSFHQRHYGLEFSDAVPLPRLIACRGQLQLRPLNELQRNAVKSLPGTDDGLVELLARELPLRDMTNNCRRWPNQDAQGTQRHLGRMLQDPCIARSEARFVRRGLIY